VPDLTYPTPSGDLRGYLASPPGAGPWPGVVVLHEIFGLTDDIRRQADRFAVHGYLALAPDLYAWGATPRCLLATLRTLSSARGRALDDVNAARTFLAEREACTGKVGVAGFCLGGGLALLVAGDGFDAAAPNYGHLPKDAEQRLATACPIVGSYGGRDRMLKGAAGKLERVLTAADVRHDVKEYPTAKHGFLYPHTGAVAMAEPLMVDYDAAAADDAWRRIFAFFAEHLQEGT
jgi:carboxymethylenebutenolidase